MIFISYRISDSLDIVGRLDADLAREFGAEVVFRDKSRLRGGHDWTRELETNAKSRRIMLVVIGDTWQTTSFTDGDWKGMPRLMDDEDWVRKEITFALDAGNIIIPVFLTGGTMPSEGWLKKCKLERLFKKHGEHLRSVDYVADFANLVRVLREQCPDLPKGPGGPTLPIRKNMPQPPDVYAVPNYILTSTFIGRATELDELDAWADSNDPVMVVEGIGGLGKSALTWEWMQNRATYAIPDLAGRVWWSFYERGTSMSAFVRHTLAYITGQDPDTLAKETSHYQRCQELLTELKRKPYLLVLDGFERMLTAYHRWDKAQQRDEKIDAGLRECVEPKDGELLQQLLRGSPSKVILSTRLFPSILEDRGTTRPIRGVQHHHLNGLSRPDTLAFFKHAGIQGNEKEMLEFADQFGCHSLLLKVICGEINQYPKRPGHFDAWRADANYGAKLKVSRLDLRQSQNHILEFALAGLDERVRKLLCRIAVLSEGMDYDTLAVLNPFLPPKPEAVDEPEHPETAYSWLWKRWTEDEKKKRIAEHEEARDRFMKYLAYFESSEYRQSILAFDEALKELRDRGLLQWDRDTTSYDMHPVVRGYASDFLEDADRKQTFLAARDHFAGLPPDDLGKATELSHVAHSLEIFRCFTGAGLLDDAAQFYCGNLAQTMRDHVCGFPMIVEMLTALFDGSKDSLPCLSSASNQAYILNDMAIAVAELGREDQALLLFAKSLRIDLERKSWPEVATGLRNLSVSSLYLNHRAERAATIALALELAMIAGDDDGVSVAIVFSADDAINEGRFAEGKRLLDDFSARPLPNVAVYRPGRAEYLFCASQFFQGVFSDADWHKGHDTALRHRNIKSQHQFLSLRCEWLLAQDQPGPALDAIDEALKIVNRIGTPKPGYHDLRAWALAKLGRNADARAELANGEQRRYAAEAWLVLDDREQARACVLSGYRRAWADGPPYIHWYELERCKAILRELGEPEPQLPAFDPAKVRPIPYEAEIRAAIAKLKEEKEAKSRDSNDTN